MQAQLLTLLYHRFYNRHIRQAHYGRAHQVDYLIKLAAMNQPRMCQPAKQAHLTLRLCSCPGWLPLPCMARCANGGANHSTMLLLLLGVKLAAVLPVVARAGQAGQAVQAAAAAAAAALLVAVTVHSANGVLSNIIGGGRCGIC